jgi:hypothetical protein
MKEALIFSSGLFCIAFAFFHLLFWKIFHWKTELQNLNPVNRGIMQVLNLRLSYIFVVVGCIMFIFPESLHATALGKFILISMSIFWFMRAIEQAIFFGISSRVSVIFVVVFLIGSLLCAAPLFV